MFILYGVVAGLAIGMLLRGSVARLGDLSFRWRPIVFAGLLVQVVIFSEPIAPHVGAVGPMLYVGSTIAVTAAIIANAKLHRPAIALVTVGALSNLLAILANGGYMPAGPAAVSALGKTPPETYSNSVFTDSPALAPLTDIFAMPEWLPFANVYSIGDLMIGVGIAWLIAATMTVGAAPSVAARQL